MTERVLVVDDDDAVREAIAQTLELQGLTPETAGSFVAAKDRIDARFDGVILSDIRMPGRDGFHLLSEAQRADRDLPVILLTGEGDIPMAVEAMGAGAFDFLEKPCAPDVLVAVVRRALSARALVLENRRLKRQVEDGDAAARLIYGVSPQAEELRARVRAVARTGADVLLTGAPGAGNAKIAEVVHLLSPAAKGPFLKQSAAALVPDAIPALMEKGAGGTLFLDEVMGLSAPGQFALLEALETGDRPRIIAGTYGALKAEAEEGRFNPELYYRLDIMGLRIPSLKERPEDIPVLFRQYVANACEQAGLPEPEITEETLAKLMAQDWPGNARALMSAAMRFALGVDPAKEEEGLGLVEQMARVERSLLEEALRQTAGQASRAAERLKLPRKTFYDKLAKHGLKPEDYRA